MKKVRSILLAAVLMLCFTGCSTKKDQEMLFYYPRNEVQYGVSDGVIAGEVRDISSYEEDLAYLLKLYLEGPLSQDLTSPFPRGTTLLTVTSDQDTIVLTLSSDFSFLENLDRTIACTCIASTCFSLTDAQSVTIQTTDMDDQPMTLTRDTVALIDSIAASDPTN